MNNIDFENLEPMSDNMFKRIKHYSFLTGSRRFKCATKKSDYDYVVHPTFSRYLITTDFIKESCVSGGSYASSDYCRSYFAKRGEKILINLLLFVSEYDYDIWKEATELFSDLCEFDKKFRNMAMDKKFRVQLFEMFKDQIRNKTDKRLNE